MDADSDEALLPGLRAWAEQLKLQTYYDKDLKREVNAYEAIEYWHDDRCCRGALKVTEHPYMQIFTFLTRVSF